MQASKRELGRVQRVGGCAGGLHRQETAKASGKRQAAWRHIMREREVEHEMEVARER